MSHIKLLTLALCVWTQLALADYSFNDITPLSSYYVTLQMDGPGRHDRDWSTFKTVATGGAIGVGTGLLARMIDSYWPGKLVYWYLTFTIRNAIVEAKLKKAYENGEKVDGNLLFNTAWASDWIAYLMTTNLGGVPFTPTPSSQTVYVHNNKVYRRSPR